MSRVPEPIAGYVVIEGAAPHHPPLNPQEPSLGIIIHVVSGQNAIVPATAVCELAERERVGRPHREDRARAPALVHEERRKIPAAVDLDGLAAAHEIVVAGIERKQKADLTGGVGPEDHDVPLIAGAEGY